MTKNLGKNTHTPVSLKRMSVFFGVCVVFFLFVPQLEKPTKSANLTYVSDTMSNSRLSFWGLTQANTEGSTLVKIATSNAPSTNTTQIASPTAQTAKYVLIGSTVYTLSNVAPYNPDTSSFDTSAFTVTSGLSSGDAASGQSVIATQSADHTIKFKTASAIANGTFRVLIKASETSGAGDDGIPDQDGFDAHSTDLAVTCPGDGSNYTFAAAVITKNVTFSGAKYHQFDCPYTGTGTVDRLFDGSNGNGTPMIIQSLINPAPKSTHTAGTADTYKVIVQNLDSGDVVRDQTTIQVGAIEGVRVTATVSPQITFQVGGIASGNTTSCGTATNVTTTPYAVPFGEIAISNFTYAAHSLTVSTNAVNGYVVTAYQNDNLGKDARACADGSFPTDCIPDATVTGLTYQADKDWTSTSNKGFGYSLKGINTTGNTTVAFQRDVADANCTGTPTFCAKQFADYSNQEPAQTLFSSTSVADSEQVDTCYKVVVSSTQPAGDYENMVVYTATATF